jgi:predicted Rossmann fold flavoprotein
VLIERMDKLGVKIIYNCNALNIKKENNLIGGVVFSDGQTIVAKNYVIAVGGKSYPQTGPIGDGYDWARALGHQIIEPTPALVPIKIKENWIKDLSGIGLKNVGIKVLQGKIKSIVATGEILFTHFGLSGPAILNISGDIGKLLQNGEVAISLNLMPQINRAELEKLILANLQKYPNKILKNCLADFVPSGLALAVARVVAIDPIKTVNDITKEERQRVVDAIQNFKLPIAGLMDFETAMITDGGVAVCEIDDKTMRSKIVNNLFFAGEIIGVHGGTGGFNL